MARTQNKSLVFFADDQPDWHDTINETKDNYLPKLKKVLNNCEIKSVFNGDDLLTELKAAIDTEQFENILVFLDLNFPSVQMGLATLNRLRRNADYRIRQVPVFIYSISKESTDVAAVYSRHGSGFYHKLNHPDTFWGALYSIDKSKGYILPNLEGQDSDIALRPDNDLPESQFTND
jgi:DNA-binding NarL/FixJ family response regulator